jgi:hypothetical protein
MSPDAQNMKTEPDAFDTAENEFGSVKHENGTRRIFVGLTPIKVNH